MGVLFWRIHIVRGKLGGRAPSRADRSPPLMPSSTRSSDPSSEFALDPPDSERLANLSGPFDAHLRLIELRMGVEIANRGNIFRISGPSADIVRSERLLRILWDDAADETLSAPAIHLSLAEADAGALPPGGDIEPQDVAIKVKR